MRKPCFAYFGSYGDIFGGDMEHLKMVASYDNFHNPFSQIDFLVIDDPKCRTKYEFNSLMPAVGLCVEGLKPGNYGLEKPDDDLSFENLVSWIPTSLTKHQMRWNERAA